MCQEAGQSGFEVFVDTSGGIDRVNLWGPSAPNTGAGTIETQGWAYEIQTYKAQTCGTFYDGLGCTNQTRRIRHTDLDYRANAGGDPDYTRDDFCHPPPSQCPAGWSCCEPGPDSCHLCAPSGSQCP
jgi:hypothetical protein